MADTSATKQKLTREKYKDVFDRRVTQCRGFPSKDVKIQWTIFLCLCLMKRGQPRIYCCVAVSSLLGIIIAVLTQSSCDHSHEILVILSPLTPLWRDRGGPGGLWNPQDSRDLSRGCINGQQSLGGSVHLMFELTARCAGNISDNKALGNGHPCWGRGFSESLLLL